MNTTLNQLTLLRSNMKNLLTLLVILFSFALMSGSLSAAITITPSQTHTPLSNNNEKRLNEESQINNDEDNSYAEDMSKRPYYRNNRINIGYRRYGGYRNNRVYIEYRGHRGYRGYRGNLINVRLSFHF